MTYKIHFHLLSLVFMKKLTYFIHNKQTGS